MPAGLSVCVVLVVLCAGSLGFPFSSHLGDENQRSSPEEGHLEADAHTLGQPHLRHSRSVPQLRASQEDGESRANLSELLARLISSRKVSRLFVASQLKRGPNNASPHFGNEEVNETAGMERVAEIHGSVRRNLSPNSRGGGPSGANHRIADRDYMGWMDFGRRSAEEYEYSS